MAKENPALKEIPNIYKNQALHLLIYAFITGVQHALPSITKKEAACMFLKRFDVDPNYDVKSIVTAFDRTRQDAMDNEKTNG